METFVMVLFILLAVGAFSSLPFWSERIERKWDEDDL